MLSFTEGMLIGQIHALRRQADANTTLLENEIRRLHGLISERDAIIDSQSRRIVANSCSIAGYRAYVETMRELCGHEQLEAASDAYVDACNAKADELKAPQHRQEKQPRAAA